MELAMTNDKQIAVWQSEFELIDELESFNFSKDDFGRYTSSLTDGRFQGFLLAKRSQPSVVLPKPEVCFGKKPFAYVLLDSLCDNLTAAGIKYTIEE